MNEDAHLAYLYAMGIPLYTPRVVLPGARPAPLREHAVIAEQVSPAVTAAKSSAPVLHLQALQQTLRATVTTTAQPQNRSAALQAKPQTVTAKPVAARVHLRFHWAIYQPVPAMLALVPIAQTDTQALSLLKKILAAIRIPESLAKHSEFVWPPTGNGDHAVPSLRIEDAREALQAFFEGCRLKQTEASPLRHVLVFDGDLAKTVFEGVDLQPLQVHLQRLVGREFPITDLFVHTTIRALAEHFNAEVAMDRPQSASRARAQKQRQVFSRQSATRHA